MEGRRKKKKNRSGRWSYYVGSSLLVLSLQRVSAQQIVQVAHLLLHPAVSRAATFEAGAVKFSTRASVGISSEDPVQWNLQVINSDVKSHITRGFFFFF